MKNILNKIEFHYSYLLIALSFILTGYFKVLLILTSIILFHEFGHTSIMLLFKNKIEKIIIYPFGGIIKTNTLENEKLTKSFLISIFGFIFQVLYYLLIIFLYKNNMIKESTFDIYKMYNINMFIFNILPIIPLDGSKILNIFLNKFFCYKKSCYLSVYISLITLIIILLNLNRFNYSYIILITLLLKNIYLYYKNIGYYFNKFLLERYLYKLKYNKLLLVNNEDYFKKEYTHIIENKGKLIKESTFLSNLFDKNSKIC
ncbi:MAG: hypothetical protein MRZ37_04430 [Tenericutes bacterium]|nr:hypothetical protein [Mycoplasmatota bacterium]